MLSQGRAEMPTSLGHTAEPPLTAGGFRLVVEDVFAISGRGVVATGRVEGTVHVGVPVTLHRDGQPIASSEIRGIEQFRKTGVQTATTGDNVGLLLGGLQREDVAGGDVVSA